MNKENKKKHEKMKKNKNEKKGKRIQSRVNNIDHKLATRE